MPSVPPSASTPASGLEQGFIAPATPPVSLPDAIHHAVVDHLDDIRALADRLRGARRVRLAGVGSSWHLAEAGEQLLRSVGMDARAANAFDLATWPSHLEPDEVLLLLCHPGPNQNAYTARLASRCTHSGLPFLAISHGDTPQMHPATVHIDLSQTPGTAQDPFAASFAVLLTIAARCAPESPLAHAATTLRDQVRHAQQATDGRLRYLAHMARDGVTLIGAGPSLPIAQHAAHRLRTVVLVDAAVQHLDSALTGGLRGLAHSDLLIHLAPAGQAIERHIELTEWRHHTEVIETWTIGPGVVRRKAPRGDVEVGYTHSLLANVPEAASPLQFAVIMSMLVAEIEVVIREEALELLRAFLMPSD